MKAKPKFNVGDTVYAAQDSVVEKKTKCPYCDGTGYWTLKTAIEEVRVACGVCEGPWSEVRGYLLGMERKGHVEILTVGEVRVEENADSCKIQYMCKETGIGSGRLWNEDLLFNNCEEAEKIAKNKAKEAEERIEKNNREIAEIEKKSAARRARNKLKKLKELGLE